MSDIFEYEVDGGTIRAPMMKNVRAGVLRKIRKLDPDDQLFTLLETVLDEESLELVDDLTAEELGQFGQTWERESGVSLGESGASSTPKKSTRKK